jgi:hypothetical protein
VNVSEDAGTTPIAVAAVPVAAHVEPVLTVTERKTSPPVKAE